MFDRADVETFRDTCHQADVETFLSGRRGNISKKRAIGPTWKHFYQLDVETFCAHGSDVETFV